MRIAIIGAGVSGLVAARLPSRQHEVTVFEAGDYAGGHTNTVEVVLDGERHAVDTGFIVFNHKTYPTFTRLLDDLRVPTAETSMSFSVSCTRTGLEYNGTTLNTLYAQRRNLLNPPFHRMVRDILRFNRRGADQAARMDDATVGQFRWRCSSTCATTRHCSAESTTGFCQAGGSSCTSSVTAVSPTSSTTTVPATGWGGTSSRVA
jgi:predicted NAD/FAD-binding protein